LEFFGPFAAFRKTVASPKCCSRHQFFGVTAGAAHYFLCAAHYQISPSSLHRHRANCLGLASSNAIMKETARGTAAVACLPSKEDLNRSYFDLLDRIDEIVAQAKAEGSLKIALSGLNSIRQTLDSLSRLSGFDRQGTQINVAVQTNITVEVRAIAERLIKEFDHEPELKARIARTLLETNNEHAS